MSDSDDEVSDRQLKLILLGDACVGKTCLATRYCSNAFAKQYLPTSGVEFLLKRDVLQKTRNVTIHIWDVGGASKKMMDKYVFNANIVIIVYDVTNELSFLSLPGWVELVRTISGPHGNPPSIAVVGNKCDMEHQRIVKHDRQNKLAAELHINSYVTSARTGEGVSLTFHRIMADFLGIRLTRSQVEEYQKVVRAEISTHSNVPAPPAPKVPVQSSSSVCCIQ